MVVVGEAVFAETFIIEFLFNNCMNKSNNSKIIRSSEISSFVYCPYAWWESRTEGIVVTKEMVAGKDFHQDYMVKQQVTRKLNVVSYVILTLILFLIIFYGVRWLLLS